MSNKTISDFVRAVDLFMEAPKSLYGIDIPQWRPGRQDAGEYKLKLPIEVDGQFSGQFLTILAYPNEDQQPAFKIFTEYESHCVCRMDYVLDHTHGNNWVEMREQGLPLEIDGPHWHKWEINRRAVNASEFPFKLPNAQPISPYRTFDDALRWYCGERNIQLGAHGIYLPGRTLLI